MGPTSIRQKAREVVLRADILTRRPDRVWGGLGTGAECSICRALVTKNQVEFELEFVEAEGVITHHLHGECFTAWECERESNGLQKSA